MTFVKWRFCASKCACERAEPAPEELPFCRIRATENVFVRIALGMANRSAQNFWTLFWGAGSVFTSSIMAWFLVKSDFVSLCGWTAMKTLLGLVAFPQSLYVLLYGNRSG